ncbi:hypothetical protein WS73_11005 [Burkholderia savannae]|nr:hypothetical protein WS73_11005 [Burkholderia savannae]
MADIVDEIDRRGLPEKASAVGRATRGVTSRGASAHCVHCACRAFGSNCARRLRRSSAIDPFDQRVRARPPARSPARSRASPCV